MEKKTRILVVDDEPDMLGVIVQRLQANGYEVSTANHGQAALASLKKSTPDLIILDVLMPVMDGFTFYKEFKRDHAAAQIPVIVLTARNKMEDTFAAVGVDAFIAKPFDAQALLAKVEELLKKPKDSSLAARQWQEGTRGMRSMNHSQIGLIMIGVFLVVVIIIVFFIISFLMESSHEGKLTIEPSKQSQEALP